MRLKLSKLKLLLPMFTWIGTCLNAMAESTTSKPHTPIAESRTAPAFQGAIGVAPFVWTVRQDYGAGNFHRYSPELFGYLYSPIQGQLYARYGMRTQYAWKQAEMPKAVRIEETDWSLGAEGGVVYDWLLVPSLSVGAGFISRTIALKTSAPIYVEKNNIDRHEWLSYYTAQVGLGLPLWDGLWVIEPFIRYLHVPDDARMKYAYGVEVSVQIF